jgi:hypothetical protein
MEHGRKEPLRAVSLYEWRPHRQVGAHFLCGVADLQDLQTGTD